MADYYFKAFEDYATRLCKEHKDLLHDDNTRRAFIRFQTGEDIQSLPNNAAPAIVIMSNFIGRAVGVMDDHQLLQTPALSFLVNVSDPQGNPYAAVQLALTKAMNIMFDFYARMIQDLEDDDCGPMRFLQPEAMNFFPIEGPVLENYYGWEMNIPFKVITPGYNPAKWNRV